MSDKHDLSQQWSQYCAERFGIIQQQKMQDIPLFHPKLKVEMV